MQYRVQAPDGSLHVIDGPEGASPEEIIAQAQRLIPVAQPQARAKTPGEEAFTAAAPGSPERVAAIPQMAEGQRAADRARSVAEPSSGMMEAYGNPIPKVVNALMPGLTLSQAGGIAGSMVPGGTAVKTAMAAAGGGSMDIVDEAMRMMAGLPAPTKQEVLSRAGKDAAVQGALQAGGEAVIGSARTAMAPLANAETEAIFRAGEKHGIPATPDQILAATNKSNPLRYGATIPRSIAEDAKTALARVTGSRAQEAISPETRAAIETATEGKLAAGLPVPNPSELAAGQSAKAFAEDEVLTPARDWARRKWDAASAFSRADPTALAKPSSLLAVGRKWYREMSKGVGDKTSLAELDNLFERLRDPSANRLDEIGQGKLHFSSLDQIRKDYGSKAFKPQPGVPTPNTAMLRELRAAAERDMDRVPNTVLKDMTRDARTVSREAVAPFQKGKGKVLANLVEQSPEKYTDYIRGAKGAQYIRELKQAAEAHARIGGQPVNMSGFDQIRSDVTHDLIERSKSDLPGGTRGVDGKKLQRELINNAGLLDELHGAGYSKDALELARVIRHAQETPKGALGRMLSYGGAYYFHPLSLAGVGSIVLGSTVASKLMETRFGVRYLAEGVAPGMRKSLASQTARVVSGIGTNALKNYLTKSSFTDEQHQKIEERMLGPAEKKQIEALKPGPAGEPPLAKIGGVADPFDAIIASSSADSKLSPQLVKATFMTESSMNPKATSPKGAQGVAQLMPALARSLGVRNPYDPTEAIPAATGHLANLMEKYKGDKRLALAAYNAGEPAVDRYGGVPPFKETQDYVLRVLKKERELEQDREKIVESAKKKPETWPAILKNYQEAKATGSKDAWRNFRSAISTHVNKQGGDPTLGMAPEEYQRWKPVLLAAMKPEPEQESTQGLDARSRKSKVSFAPEYSDNQMQESPGLPQGQPSQPMPSPGAQPGPQPTPGPGQQMMARAPQPRAPQANPVSASIQGMDRGSAYRIVSGVLSMAQGMQLPPQIKAAAHSIRESQGDAFTKAVRLADILVSSGVVRMPESGAQAWGG